MSEIVFILGAGASNKSGAPLVKDFLIAAEELNRSENLGEFKSDFDKVNTAISELQSVHSKSKLNISNIESIFATFEMGRLIKKLPGFKVQDIDPLIESLKRLIFKTLEMKIKFNYRGGKIRPDESYNSLVRNIININNKESGTNSCSIITFNYDLALDYAFHFNNLSLDYCLSDAQNPKSIPVMKLHGSLNWVKCEKCGRVVPWYLKDFFDKYHYRYLSKDQEVIIDLPSKLSQEGFEHCGEKIENNTPLIVPPTWNKTFYHNDLSIIWARAAKELSDAENIFVSGYSLTPNDSFFRYLFAIGSVGKTLVKRFWVFDPDESGEVKNRFNNLIGQAIKDKFLFEKKTFQDLLGEVSNLNQSKYF